MRLSAGALRRDAPGHEQTGDQRDIKQQLELGREIDEREVTAGIFEHHRLVHHGELEMRRGVVDRDARVLGDRHHDQRDQRKPERDAQARRVGAEKAAMVES